MKKTVLITGASSGFGLMLASERHKTGYNVIGTSWHPEKYAGKVQFKLLRLDIEDDHSINEFTQALFAQTSQLDVLINNAGYMVTGLAEETPLQVGREQFETNFWGTVKLTHALLLFFRKQKSGKIITVSSIVGLIGPPNLSYYTASKHAVEGYFKSLRFEVAPFNIKVSMVEPVWFKTNLGNHAVSPTGNLIPEYDTYRKQVQALTRKGLEEADAPDAVISTLIRLIQTKEPKFSNPVGKMTGILPFLQSYLPGIFEGSILRSVKAAK
ncbi:SDR family NAD(P)-dependent oxidoreductase (plasmid) [Pantoea agglomerans]|uniref:SDR family NAD(P)-dependent oxidoreductase n=1 Tax=Enterobacter agglomerans TaxID=549 RepID=UPI0028C506D1|nr:SDR family NAD(P)-dependent oxidoreductase [Pantoea agglomerans]WNN36660.1 SDR family NAD(P)-dependent oxidoreductase [Pantoea agglomerans]